MRRNVGQIDQATSIAKKSIFSRSAPEPAAFVQNSISHLLREDVFFRTRKQVLC